MNNMKRYYGLDTAKFVASFAVVCLHTSYGKLDGNIVELIRLFSRWAVPYFFIVSGFFSSLQSTNRPSALFSKGGRIYRLVKLFIVAQLVYGSLQLIREGSLLHKGYFIGFYYHLWFIPSLIIGTLIVQYFVSIRRYIILGLLCVLILFIELLLNYGWITLNEISCIAVRMLLSLPFIAIGMLFARKDVFKIFEGKVWLILALIVIGFGLESETLISSSLSLFNIEFSLSIFLLTIYIFVIGLLRSNKSVFSFLGEKYSLFIYLYHPLVYLVLTIIIKYLVPEHVEYVKMIYPILCFTITLTLAYILHRKFNRLFHLLQGF